MPRKEPSPQSVMAESLDTFDGRAVPEDAVKARVLRVMPSPGRDDTVNVPDPQALDRLFRSLREKGDEAFADPGETYAGASA